MWKKLKKAWKKVKNMIKKVVRVAKEVAQRAVGVVDLVASLVGIRPTKFLRLRVFILTDLRGRPVQDHAEVMRWVTEMRRVFRDRINIEVNPPDLNPENFVTIIADRAPSPAMSPGCSVGDAFGEAADYYEDHATYTRRSAGSLLADLLGYGEMVYGFVVHSIDRGNKDGCAFPFIQDFCTVEPNPKTTTLAHEVAHLCGLGLPRHHRDPDNLMNPNRDDMDSELTGWQIAVVRNSRYVTYFRSR